MCEVRFYILPKDQETLLAAKKNATDKELPPEYQRDFIKVTHESGQECDYPYNLEFLLESKTLTTVEGKQIFLILSISSLDWDAPMMQQFTNIFLDQIAGTLLDGTVNPEYNMNVIAPHLPD